MTSVAIICPDLCHEGTSSENCLGRKGSLEEHPALQLDLLSFNPSKEKNASNFIHLDSLVFEIQTISCESIEIITHHNSDSKRNLKKLV